MIHRAILGSFERFFGILIEHYKGEFPLWLAPVQVVVLPVSEKFNDYSFYVYKYLKTKNIRVEIDVEPNKLSYKIRQAEVSKIPLMIVIGQKEQDERFITVRKKGSKELKQMKLEEFVDNFFGGNYV
jgi:threonyl-tRNA synthetase